MATSRELSGEIQRFIVAEVQNHLRPLVEKVDKQGNTLRSLYANGSGGPPGYLEMARAEDRETQKRIFSKLDKIAERLDIAEDFINTHNAREDQRDYDRKVEAANVAEKLEEAEKRSNRRIAWLGVLLAGLMALFAVYDHRDGIKHTLLDMPDAHSQIQPQDAVNPQLHFQGR